MIKKLLIFLLFWFCLLFLWNSTKATFEYMQVWLWQNQSYWNTNYDIWVIKKGRFISTYLWLSKNVLALDNQKLYFWNNWWLYFFDDTFSLQWYLQYMTSCDEITLSWDLQNCWSPTVVGLYDEVVWNFINSLIPWDWVMVEQYPSYNLGCGGWCTYNRFYTRVCFSSSTYHHTLCFLWDYSDYNAAWYEASYPLWSSLGLASTTTFWNIDRNLLSEPPGFTVWDNIEWSSNTSENVSLTWNLLYNKCTNWYVINKIRSVYWSEIDRVCYAWTTNTWLITSENVDQISSIFHWTPKQWLDFKMLYQLTSNWESRNNRFRSYEYEMLLFKEWRVWINPFIWRPIALYSYFDILYYNWNLWRTSSDDGPDWMGPYFILNYCKLSYTDLDSEYKWSYFSSYCSDLSYSDPWQIIDEWTNNWSWQVDNDDEVLPPWFDNWNNNVTWSWTAVSVDWSWVLSWESNKNYDWITFINDMYQKLQQNFLKPYNWITWIVPSYILVFLLALILFRFLQH